MSIMHQKLVFYLNKFLTKTEIKVDIHVCLCVYIYIYYLIGFIN